MTGAPSAAYAQCFGSLNAATSVIGTVNTAFLPGGSAFLSSSPNGAPDQLGGGAWTRAVAGSADTEANTNFNALLTVMPPGTPPGAPGVPAPPVSKSCRASVKQDFAGFEAGHDIAALTTANSDWHFGVLAGYVGAKGEAPQGVTGDFQSGDVEAPSAGLYTAYYNGPFSADVQARLYELQIESLGQRLDANGYSFAGNAGYRLDLPGNWTLEPSVGGIFSHTSINQLYVDDALGSLGIPASALPFPGALAAAASGTLQIQDVESVLGRASVKLGTTLPLAGGQVVAYPFVTASVFHEFEGSVNALVTTNGTSTTAPGVVSHFQGSGNITVSGIGTYGQFGLGSAFQFADTGWLGFTRVDYRTGDNIQGYSVSAGLRYQLDNPPSAEKRARYPVKAVPAHGYDWTGPYAGLSAGSTWGHTRWADQGAPVDPDYAGVLAGGQAGYNFQTGHFVGGIEGDAGWSNARGATACPINPLLYSCEDDVGALGSVTGRFGYAWGRALFYAKGGWAFGEVTAGTSLNFGASAPLGMTSTNWENGWTVGGGMEFALTDRWSAKAEYMHYEFPQYAFTVGQGATANATAGGDLVRIGVNYHFRP